MTPMIPTLFGPSNLIMQPAQRAVLGAHDSDASAAVCIRRKPQVVNVSFSSLTEGIMAVMSTVKYSGAPRTTSKSSTRFACSFTVVSVFPALTASCPRLCTHLSLEMTDSSVVVAYNVKWPRRRWGCAKHWTLIVCNTKSVDLTLELLWVFTEDSTCLWKLSNLSVWSALKTYFGWIEASKKANKAHC